MEFWGVEVKPGKSLKVQPGDDKMIHLSQASLGEYQKDSGNDSIILSLKINGTDLVLGTLAAVKIPQIAFDLVFEKEFELSHNWKNGSIYFCGYKANTEQDEDELDYDISSDDELDTPLENVANGKPEPKAAKPKAALAAAAAKPAQKPVESKKKDDDEDSDESDDDDLSGLPVNSEESDDSDDSDDDSDESDDEDMLDEDEETPKKVESAKKKRPTESAIKTPQPAKKVKLASPQKTDDAKKGNVHSATPHPKKQAAKTPAPASEKSKAPATPKSGGGLVSCNSCSKKFNSDKALESHTKAKHEAK